MATVRLRNVNPLGQVDLPIAAREGEPLGEHGTGCLEPGEVFAVDAKVAGRPPQLHADGSYVLDDDTGEPVDRGEGLLAQVGNYELAEGHPSPAKPRKKTSRRKPAAKKTAAPAADQPPAEPAVDTVTEV